MELIINELGNEDIFNSYNNSFEKIPENSIPVKVIKKGVHFNEPIKPIHQSIPKVNAKMIRQHTPILKPQISYEDILSKMGMFVSDGKLHLVDKKSLPKQQSDYNQEQQQYNHNIPEQYNHNIPQNSYIHNKYFANQNQPNEIRKPKTLTEYKKMVIQDYIKKQKIKQIKSTKLIMPTSNINMAGHSSNLNKLFNFSQR